MGDEVGEFDRELVGYDTAEGVAEDDGCLEGECGDDGGDVAGLLATTELVWLKAGI